MPPPNGLETYMFLACPSICPSVRLPVCDVFSVAITNEPLDGSSWNCRNIFYTLKMKGWVVFLKSCDPRWPPEWKLPEIAKNGQKNPLLVHNFVLDCNIDLSLFYYIPEVIPKKLKVQKIVANYRKSLEIAKNSNKLPILVQNFVLDWDFVLI